MRYPWDPGKRSLPRGLPTLTGGGRKVDRLQTYCHVGQNSAPVHTTLAHNKFELEQDCKKQECKESRIWHGRANGGRARQQAAAGQGQHVVSKGRFTSWSVVKMESGLLMLVQQATAGLNTALTR